MLKQIQEFFGKMFSCFTPSVKENSTLKRDVSCGELCCMGLSSTTASEILDYKEPVLGGTAKGLGVSKSCKQPSLEAQKIREKMLNTTKSNGMEMSR